MAGHSKWKQIKRKKAVTDSRRASALRKWRWRVWLSWLAQKEESGSARRLTKTSTLISERPPRGGLSFSRLSMSAIGP